MKIDAEFIADKISAHLKANLNTKIAEINAEKNDNVVLKTLNSKAYFFQGLNETVINYDPFLLFGLADIGGEGVGPATLTLLTFTVSISVVDPQDLLIGKRMFRYGRALREVFEEGFDKVHPGVKFRIKDLVPIPYTLINTNDPYRAVGVNLYVSIA